MSNATFSIRAHFDGKFIIPDEPVNLPVDVSLDIVVNEANRSKSQDNEEIAKKLAALGRFTERGVHGAAISDESLRRDAIYGDEGR